MAIVKTEPGQIKFGPERKKLGGIKGPLYKGGEVTVPDELIYILEKGTYEMISENKTQEAPKKSKKSKNNKKETKVVDEASIEDQSTLENKK